MEKFKVSFVANNQQLTATGTKHASDTYADIEATFALGERWTDMDSVSAVWWNDFTRIATVLDSEGKCTVPHEVLMRKGCVRVNLVGSVVENGELVTRLTSYSAEAVHVNEKIKLTGSETTEITPSQFEQFVENVKADADRAESAKESAQDASASAQGYAQSASASASSASESATSAEQSATASARDAQTVSEIAVEVEVMKNEAELARDEILGMSAEAVTLPAGSEATASYADGLLSLGIPRGNTGATGAKGDRGDTGATPNLTIGTVETLEPTQDAYVTRRGTDDNPIFDFGIPKGDTGDVSQAQLDEAVTDLKSDLNYANKGEYYLNDANFELGAIGFLENSWSYYSSDSRVRTKQGITYHLNVGDYVSLSNYSNARYYLGWINGDGQYKSVGWLTSDYTITEEGDYAFLLSNITETTQDDIYALFNLLSVHFQRTDVTLSVFNDPADASVVGSRFKSIEDTVDKATNIIYGAEDFSSDQFEMGYYYGVNVGEPLRFGSSANRFCNKRGTAFHFKKGTILHIKTSAVDASGSCFWLHTLDSDGMWASTSAVITHDYVIPSDGNYCISFRKVTEGAISSISDYLETVSYEYDLASAISQSNYNGFIVDNSYSLPFSAMAGWFNTAGNIETPDATNKEKYTTIIPIPASKKIHFDLTYASKHTLYLRVYTMNEAGSKVDYRTLAGGVATSSMRYIAEFTDSEKYVIFTYRSYDDATVSAKAYYGQNIKHLRQNVPFYSMLTPPKTRLVNHRGYETLAPENSIPAFTLAGERGAFGVECDVSSTSDGKLIIMHDNTVDRTTDGSGTVTNLTYAQIQAMHIDAGANVGQYSQEELIIPTFEDFIKICRKYGMMAIIEVKLYGDLGNFVKSMLETIYKYGMQNSSMILTSNDDVINMIRAYDSMIQITVFGSATTVVDKYKPLGNMGISIDKTASSIGMLAEYAHLNQMTVNVYVSDGASEDETLKQYFPDFITTETTLS